MRHYVFWAHSPIGYETFLALKEAGIFNESNSTLITAREFFPSEANACIGLPEEYLWQSPAEFEVAQEKIVTALKRLQNDNIEYELFVPQTANFFVRALIESPRCQSFVLFDEGSGARGALFSKRCVDVFYKYQVRPEKSLSGFLAYLAVKPEVMTDLYRQGVPFYDVRHPKCAGYISFFEDAFPGETVIRLKKPSFSGTSICSKHGLILLPPFHAWAKSINFTDKFQTFYNSINSIARLNSTKKWVLKFHPHDNEEVQKKILSSFKFDEFGKFCKTHKISEFREPAFMGFDTYVSSVNSTVMFLRADRHQYIALAHH